MGFNDAHPEAIPHPGQVSTVCRSTGEAMNVKNGRGAIHHLVETTRRLLCGHREPFDWTTGETRAAVDCRACVRMLEDDVRRAGPTVHDSED
jgi:hypothetical protein